MACNVVKMKLQKPTFLLGYEEDRKEQVIQVICGSTIDKHPDLTNSTIRH